MTEARLNERPRRRRAIERHMLIWHVGKWDAPVYAGLVAIGVPLMAYFNPSVVVKLTIAMLWFELSLLYWWIELKEVLVDIQINGLLDIPRRNQQKQSMQLLFWGAAIAIVIWVLFLVRGDSPFQYGLIEWSIIVHTVAMATFTINALYPLIDSYLQATAGQRRIETDE